ncbi:MAG: polynucleotide adenylyltransferase PcnB [Gammaproteobacteria bacterium]
MFRNSRLIGRRFRLAHVRFGRDIIEVATFRASADQADDRSDVELDQHGRILRDNVYGSIDEDVWRRDFTANALYYNIADYSIWDYVDGARDIEHRVLRLIGDPEQRLREDPVRMLRAVRFAAKLDFTIDEDIAGLMPELGALLAHVPAARLFDEFVKMFQSGHARRTFELLLDHGLFGRLFPETRRELDGPEAGKFREFIALALANTDQRVAEGKAVTPMFLLGVFLWAPVRTLAARLMSEHRMSETQALGIAASEIVAAQQSIISIPRRFSTPMREMLSLQPRFEKNRGKRALAFLEHRRFRAAYDFMLLRSRVGGVDPELAGFWTEVQEMSGEERARAFHVQGAGGKRRDGGRRRRPRRRKPRDGGA